MVFVHNNSCFFLRLYLNGVDFNISALYPEVEYPVSRGTHSLSDLVGWNHNESLNQLTREYSDDSVSKIHIDLKQANFEHIHGHIIQNSIVVPVSTYLVSQKLFV